MSSLAIPNNIERVNQVNQNSQVSFKQKTQETIIKTLKVASAVLLTIAAYSALVGAMTGLFLLTQDAHFATEHGGKFVISVISALGVGALSSMSNPFKLYQNIFKSLYSKAQEDSVHEQIRFESEGIELKVLKKRDGEEVTTMIKTMKI